MNSYILALLLVLLSVHPPLRSAEPRENTRLQVRDGRFYIDGQRFIVRGIGYEPGTRPGQYPWSRKFEPKVIAHDLRRIKEAGFNTLRCWSGYSEEELDLIEKNGLWVIQGIWVDPHGDFGNPKFIRDAVKQVEKVVTMSSRHKNILMYIVMNEPKAETILKSGEEETLKLFRTLRDRVHMLHPGVPVTFANTCIGDFLDSSLWDAVGFNLYMYAPVTVRDVLGYRGYVEWIKKKMAESVPLVITEYGLSVSRRGEGRFGYGGNSLQDQADGDLWMLDSLIQGKAEGSCAFIYADGWWKNAERQDDAATHDDEPEEWFGLMGIDDKNSDPLGTPRPSFYAYKKANRALWIEPVSWRLYKGNISVEVYAMSDVDQVTVETGSGLRADLTRQGKWWRATIPAQELKGMDTLILTARSKIEGTLRQERTLVTDWSKVPERLRPVHFDLERSPKRISAGKKIPVTIRAQSPTGGPVAKRTFVIGSHPHVGFSAGKSFKAESDVDGRISFELDSMKKAGIITLSISTGHDPLQTIPTWGEAFVLRVGE